MPPDRGAGPVKHGTSNTKNAKTKTSERKNISNNASLNSPGGTRSTPVKKASSVPAGSPNYKSKDQVVKDKVRLEKAIKSDVGKTDTKDNDKSKPELVKKVKRKEATTETAKFKEPVIKSRTTRDVGLNLNTDTKQTGLKNKTRDTMPVKAQSVRNVSVSKGAIKKEVLHTKEVLPPTKTVKKTKTSSLGSKNEPFTSSPSNNVNESNHRKVNQNRSLESKDKKDKETEGRLGHQRTKTRTLSPRESKLLSTQVEQEEKRKQAERDARRVRNSPIPGTSRDGLTSHPLESSSYDEPNVDVDEYEYEDDFEDYESDFEDDIESDMSDSKRSINGDTYSITDDEGDTDMDTGSEGLIELTAGHKLQKEEEKKLDSGNYDLAERKRKNKELQEIKLAVERENSSVQTRNKERMHLVPADEGFVEGRVDDIKTVSPVTAHNFINFASARKRQLEKKTTAKVKKRGDELFSMIKLDVMNYYLYDIAPIPYEVYMKSYGRSNTIQAYVQTNEDNLSEEVQTEEIHMKNKWTQKPVTFNANINSQSGKNSESVIRFSNKEYLGVGGDNTEEELDDEWIDRIKVNSIRLSQFLSSAGQVILSILEEETAYNQGMLKKSSEQIRFSDGYIELGLKSIPFLVGYPVSYVCFPLHVSTMLLSVHQGINQKFTEDNSSVFKGSLLCVWNILEPSYPHKLLIVNQNVTASCFEPEKAGLVFAGLSDGSICVWDLKEHSSYHQKININGSELILRSPTYTTAEVIKDGGHTVPVVALRPLINHNGPEEKFELSAVQICSLDESGIVIIWTIIRSYNDASKSGIFHQDLGVAYWGRIRLTLSTVISLQESISVDQSLHSDLQCFDLAVDGDHLYIALNTGHVVHCLKDGGKAKPKLYSQKWDGLTFTKCIEICPFMLPFFLVGCSDGTVRLYSRSSEKPLTTIAGTGDPMGQGPQVLTVQWLKTKPFILFVLDSLSRLHFWDLSAGDMYPQYTVPLSNKKVTSIQLSGVSGDKKESVYMAMATSAGSIEVHCLKEEFSIPSVQTLSEVEKFLHYISHL